MPEYKKLRTKGILEERRGNSGRFRVLAFKRMGHFVYDNEEIKKEFPPHGFAFAPGIFNYPDNAENTIWEFSAIPGESTIDGGDIMRLDVNMDYVRLDFQVFDIYEAVMLSPSQFNQPLLNPYFNDVTSKFYIHHNENLYGPFKIFGGEVVPEIGRHVNLYGHHPRIHEINGRQYLLEPPSDNNIIAKVECYTRSQLADWFKREVRATRLKIDWNEWELLLETWDGNMDGSGRFNQVESFMERLKLSHEEIKLLAESSITLKRVYQESIDEVKDEIKKEELIPAIQVKELLEKECKSLKETIKSLQYENDILNDQKKKTTEEYQFINDQKDRLINDIKIHAIARNEPITPTTKIMQEKGRMNTYEIQLFEKTKEIFPDLKSFVKQYEDLFGEEKNTQKQGMLSFFQLKQYKAILCKDIDLVIQFGRLTNNCKLFIQQVEADWIRFENLYRNGLKQSWESAMENTDTIHFLLLEDVNLASIECYGRPLLDLLSKRREKLPGINTEWPSNLWLFGIPLEVDEPLNFGLPLIKNTFKHWGAIPSFNFINTALEKSDIKHLPVTALYNHEIDAPTHMNDYFPL